MKKIIIGILLLFVIVGTIIFIITKNSKPDVKDSKVKVAEVAHSIFYAPQYIADKKGFFNEEGLEVEFILTPGADKVTAAVLSKDVDIGFCGSEASIYVYKNNKKDYIVNFASLTNKDGSSKELEVDGLFIAIGRVPETENFKKLVKINDAGYIEAKEDCHTNVDGIFVAGDTRVKELRQLVTATSDGAIAATEAVKYLNK